MMKRFEQIDISGDAGIRAYGRDLSDLFLNAAHGMYSLITEPGGISPTKSIEIETEAGSREGLLVSWLNELIFHFDAHGFLGGKIVIHELTDTYLSAAVSGEDFDPEKHDSGLLIKAATHHKVKVEEKDGHLEAEVIFDI
jgi:SHS2 domain-containing protein